MEFARLVTECAVERCEECGEQYKRCGARHAAQEACSAAHVCTACKAYIRRNFKRREQANLDAFQRCPHTSAVLRRCRACCLQGAPRCWHSPALRWICVACGEALRKELQRRARREQQARQVPTLAQLCVRRVSNDAELLLAMAATVQAEHPIWQTMETWLPPKRERKKYQETKYSVISRILS